MTTPSTTATAGAPDFAAVTARQQQVWATGDYHAVGLTLVPAAEALVAAAGVRAGRRVLDVCCGSGNVALAAARRSCDATGVDYVPALLDRARRRADAEGLTVDFRAGDAQRLEFPDDAFDVVLSMFGVMFAPDQPRTATELVRVCRPGGTIGLACWMPQGFGAAFFGAVAKYAPPPPGLQSPLRWGDESCLRQLLGDTVASLRVDRPTVSEYFRSVDDAVSLFRNYFGPVRRAFEAQDPAGQRALADDLAALFQQFNRATDGTLAMELDYMRAIATLR